MPAEVLHQPEMTTVPLGPGCQLIVRPVIEGDLAALTALYAGMTDEDGHRRFFCGYRPQPSWFVDLTEAGAHGGARLVAEVTTATDTELVGEAGYAALPNGNGEVALLVAKRWRGWLGPYLLARLLDEAARRGVPNLEADVLTENRPMLALLRHFGAVVMEHDGWSTLRVRIGTCGQVATWDGTGPGLRVLVETPDGRWTREDEARAAGISLFACFGPGSSNRQCPVLEGGGRCPLVDDADVVIVRYPPDDETWARLIDAHRRNDPGVTLILEGLRRGGGAEVTDVADLRRLAVPRRRLG
jgi:RimJ/RimL family protein N-acetyltransferase